MKTKDKIIVVAVAVIAFAVTTLVHWWGGYNFQRGEAGMLWLVSSIIASLASVFFTAIFMDKI